MDLFSGIRSRRKMLRKLGQKVTASPDLWYPVLLVVTGILFFLEPLFLSKNFYFRDILNFHYPLRKVLIESYARGEFPLWNPYVYLGQPMLANPNYMAFYPTNLFHLFLPFNYAFKLHFIVHPLLGGLGIYFLQRRLGIVPLAALGGATVYQFSGTVLSFLNLYNIVPVVALLPWIGWSFLFALEGGFRWRRTVLFGAPVGLQVIALEPVTFQCNIALVLGLAVHHALASRERGAAAWRIVRVGAVGSVLALGFAALQVVSALELIPLSARGPGYDYAMATGWSMHPADLVNAALPHLFGTLYTVNNGEYWGESFHWTRE